MRQVDGGEVASTRDRLLWENLSGMIHPQEESSGMGLPCSLRSFTPLAGRASYTPSSRARGGGGGLFPHILNHFLFSACQVGSPLSGGPSGQQREPPALDAGNQGASDIKPQIKLGRLGGSVG